jgi:predicted site-specific integrase-resolvase
MDKSGNQLETMSEKEFSRRVGISRITAWRLRRAGKLSHYRIGTRILYGEQHIAEFLQTHEQRATQKRRG